jgi:hypothetical protein
MIKETITYTDFAGNERTEDHRFNLTKAEIMRMEMSTQGGLAERINRIIAAQDAPAIIAVFEDLIQKSYGVLTPDGRGFVKRKEDLDAFMATNAYSELFMKLATDSDAAAKFVNGIVPADMAQQMNQQMKKLPQNI